MGQGNECRQREQDNPGVLIELIKQWAVEINIQSSRRSGYRGKNTYQTLFQSIFCRLFLHWFIDFIHGPYVTTLFRPNTGFTYSQPIKTLHIPSTYLHRPISDKYAPSHYHTVSVDVIDVTYSTMYNATHQNTRIRSARTSHQKSALHNWTTPSRLEISVRLPWPFMQAKDKPWRRSWQRSWWRRSAWLVIWRRRLKQPIQYTHRALSSFPFKSRHSQFKNKNYTQSGTIE